MATTSPINGLPIPDDNSPNLPPIHFQAFSDVLDTRLVARFATTTARNNAITAPVEGMLCVVAGYPQVYRAGAWHGLVHTVFSTSSMTTTLSTVSMVVATLAIPDPSFSYKIKAGACVDLAVLGAGVHARALVRVNASALIPAGTAAFNDTGGTLTDQMTWLPTPAVSGTRTGASTVDLYISKESGPAGNGFQVSSTTGGLFNILWAEVIPV